VLALNTTLFNPGDRLGIAVSGGADSVALLRTLLERRAELGLVLSIVHFNHKLRGDESDLDERFVTDLAREYDLPLYGSEADTKTFAREKALSIEAAARDLRYSFFGKLIKERRLDKVATAHTLDDQSETVLLRIIRGTGTSGLAGILPRLKVGKGAIVRPLLHTRRAEIVSYLKERNQSWHEDSTNSETIFTRNRLRHEVLPRLAAFNPEITASLSNLAEIARVEDEYWASATADAFVRCYRANAIEVTEFLKLHQALQRRVLRLAAIQKGANLDFEHTEQILKILQAPPSREQRTIELPQGFRAVLTGPQLLITTDEPQPKPCGFNYALPIPGEVTIRELRLLLRAELVTGVTASTPRSGYPISDDAYNDDHQLAIGRLTTPLTVRNWRPGDRFWPAHTRSEKKVKDLLQDRRVPSREKSLWPVVLAGDQIVWMRGFPVSSSHAAKAGEQAVVFVEVPLGE
jgi:tRNA(Ile)-lysidine synthase